MSTIREDFEAWGARNRYDVGHKGEDGSYLGMATAIAWEAYQAATERAAKAVEDVKSYAAITHVVEAETRRRCVAAIRAQTGGEHG